MELLRISYLKLQLQTVELSFHLLRAHFSVDLLLNRVSIMKTVLCNSDELGNSLEHNIVHGNRNRKTLFVQDRRTMKKRRRAMMTHLAVAGRAKGRWRTKREEVTGVRRWATLDTKGVSPDDGSCFARQRCPDLDGCVGFS
ncbi:hypothetical protein RYX36_017732 [Vicia faba]